MISDSMRQKLRSPSGIRWLAQRLLGDGAAGVLESEAEIEPRLRAEIGDEFVVLATRAPIGRGHSPQRWRLAIPHKTDGRLIVPSRSRLVQIARFKIHEGSASECQSPGEIVMERDDAGRHRHRLEPEEGDSVELDTQMLVAALEDRGIARLGAIKPGRPPADWGAYFRSLRDRHRRDVPVDVRRALQERPPTAWDLYPDRDRLAWVGWSDTYREDNVDVHWEADGTVVVTLNGDEITNASGASVMEAPYMVADVLARRFARVHARRIPFKVVHPRTGLSGSWNVLRFL